MIFIVLLTIFIAAAGGWFYLRKQKVIAERDARAAQLFKPSGRVLGDVAANLARPHAAEDNQDDSDGDAESLLADNAVGSSDSPTGAAGAKVLSRLEQKKREKLREKEERRAALAAAIEQRNAARQDADEKAADAAAEERRKQHEEDAAIAALRLEKKLQEDEDYKKWTSHIGLECKGELGAADEQEERLKKFLTTQAPNSSKVLVLDTTAKSYNVSVERLVGVLESLKESGSVSGVLDDRGKFIFVSDAEYRQIAKFLNNRGRVSMTELIREANRIVDAPEP